MVSKPKKFLRSTRPRSGMAQALLGLLRSVVATWRGYIALQSWAIAVYAIILVVSGNLFTMAGVVLLGGVALTILLYYLDKWLNTR